MEIRDQIARDTFNLPHELFSKKMPRNGTGFTWWKNFKKGSGLPSYSKMRIVDEILLRYYLCWIVFGLQKISEFEQKLRFDHQKVIKKLGEVNFHKNDFIFASDVDLKFRTQKFIKLPLLEDINSFMRIKKQCESISNELAKNLNTSV